MVRKIKHPLFVVSVVILSACITKTELVEDSYIRVNDHNIVKKIITDPEGNYILAGNDLEKNEQLIKVDQTGAILWSVDTPVSCDNFVSLAEGAVLVLGSVKGYPVTNARLGLVKYTANGELVWMNLDLPIGYSNHAPIALDGDQNIFLAAAGIAKIDQHGLLLWYHSADAGGASIAVDNAGDVYTGGGNHVYKFAGTTGDPLWEKEFTDASGYDYCITGVATDSQGNVITLGGKEKLIVEPLTRVYGYAFIIKYAPDGSLIWRQKHNPTGVALWGFAQPGMLAVDSKDNIVTSFGSMECYGYFPYEEYWLPLGSSFAEFVAYNKDGELLWNRRSNTNDLYYDITETGILTIDGHDGIFCSNHAYTYHYRIDGSLIWKFDGYLFVDHDGTPYRVKNDRTGVDITKYKEVLKAG